MGYLLKENFSEDIDEIIEESEDNPTRLIGIFIVFYIVSALILFPLNFIIISAAFAFSHLWGFWTGFWFTFVLNAFCSNLIFIIAFFLGKYMLHDCVKKYIVGKNQTLKILNKAVKNHGIKITALMRASFIIPENIVSYSLSVTDVSFCSYFIGGQAFLPVSLIYIHIGATSASVSHAYTEGGDGWFHTEELYLTFAGMAVLFLALFLVVR
jgi:uncharacterized membrane protein YdjX (TVP38/TMEM64 family)